MHIVTLRDVLTVAGFIALERGLALVYVPAAWIVGGVLLLLAGYRMAR